MRKPSKSIGTGVDAFVRHLQSTPRISQNLVAHRESPPRRANFADFPVTIHPVLRSYFAALGIKQLYCHQKKAIDIILKGHHTVVSSGVASGKSICYQIPVMNSLLENPACRALLIFPTKALAQDQSTKLGTMLQGLANTCSHKTGFFRGIYDGDTPTDKRSSIRKNAAVLFTNPDMLHMGILPHHAMWAAFFANLRYIVVDEVHIYRGVFGSQVANVFRRLKRICRFYGSNPQFIFTSATLANAADLCANLIGAEVEIIDTDDSPAGHRDFFILNPPMLNKELGIRRSSMLESSYLARMFSSTGCQAILFSETRRAVEMLYLFVTNKAFDADRIRSYRSGYLPEERRKIESELREHKIDLVISTNALELGIDIGGLDAVFINGFPGTICSTVQQSGRAGRKAGSALTVLVASSNPLDQYICRNPAYIFDKNPEQALINPDNAEILIRHLHCAISEMAVVEGESYGNLAFDQILPFLNKLIDSQKIRKIGKRFVGCVGAYPAGETSLRNMTSQFQLISDDTMIGYVDEFSAHWMTHPGAVYLHGGETWVVNNMDFEKRVVTMEYRRSNYYTQATQNVQISLLEAYENQVFEAFTKHLGSVNVLTTITGFKKLRFYTQELMGYEELDMPPRSIDTVAWWVEISSATVNKIKASGMWRSSPNDYGKNWDNVKAQIRERDGNKCQNCGAMESTRAHDVHHKVPFKKFENPDDANAAENLVTLCPSCHRMAEQTVLIQSGLAGVAYLISNLAPLHVMCDFKDLGVKSEESSELANANPAIIVYDTIPGGIGLSKKLYELCDEVLMQAHNTISQCPCEDGCPACVGPVAENGEGAKAHAGIILESLLGF